MGNGGLGYCPAIWGTFIRDRLFRKGTRLFPCQSSWRISTLWSEEILLGKETISMNSNKNFSQPLPEEHELKEMIARRAYEIFLSRGSVHGGHFSDWIRAEQEIAVKLLDNLCPLEFAGKITPRARLVRKKPFAAAEFPSRAEKQLKRKKSPLSPAASILRPDSRAGKQLPLTHESAE